MQHRDRVPLIVDDTMRAFLHPSITGEEESTEVITPSDLYDLCGMGYTFKIVTLEEFIPCVY